MKKYILFIFLIYVSTFCYVQNSITDLQVTPLSPNAKALTQYIDYPVAHYDGVPNISIPCMKSIVTG